MNYYEIGQRIRKNRKAIGLSQEELAEKVGISATHMSHIETGNTKLSLPVLVSLAEALEVSADELLFEAKPTSRSADLNDIMAMLGDCSSKELCAIRELVRASKTALRKYF